MVFPEVSMLTNDLGTEVAGEPSASYEDDSSACGPTPASWVLSVSDPGMIVTSLRDHGCWPQPLTHRQTDLCPADTDTEAQRG